MELFSEPPLYDKGFRSTRIRDLGHPTWRSAWTKLGHVYARRWLLRDGMSRRMLQFGVAAAQLGRPKNRSAKPTVSSQGELKEPPCQGNQRSQPKKANALGPSTRQGSWRKSVRYCYR